MTQEQALKTLINVAEAACTRGLFTLAEAKAVAEAVQVIITPVKEVAKEVVSEKPSKNKD